MALSVLKKKLRKVQDMRTDTPAMLEALDALSTFYDPSANTLDARRSLRVDLEMRGLRLVEDFVSEFEPIQARIDHLNDHVEAIHAHCDDLLERLEASATETAQFAEASRSLAGRRAQVAERAQVMDNFLRRFKLSQKQLDALGDGPTAADGGALFFSALEDVQRIRGECQALISSQFQSAGLALFDAMAAFQEQAHELLFGWVHRQCQALDEEFPEPSEALQKGIATLAQAPAYYDHTRDCVAEARCGSISKRFAIALTGGQGVRPIEMHAHDPVRYVGDMLAWVHQNMAVERSLINKLFPADARPAAPTAPQPAPTGAAPSAEEETAGAPALSEADKNARTLNKVFEGAMGPLTVRVRQVLASPLQLVVAFKLGSLLEYYQGTLETLTGAQGLAVETLGMLRAEAEQGFFGNVKQQCDKLLASPPAYPRDLSVALEVSELIRRLGEVLTAFDEAITEQGSREERFKPVLDAFVPPLLDMCRKSAASLDRSDGAIYIINNLVAVQGSLTRYDFTAATVQELAGEISDWSDVLVKEQADAILRRSGVMEKMELIERDAPASHPGMDVESLRQVMDAFYQSMFSLVMPEFDRLVSPRLRASARNATARSIATAYESFYKRLHEVGGLDAQELAAVLVHSPEQVRQLLDA